jgi:hypothetical protein
VASSTGDDIANLADEDGVAIPALAEGVATNIVVTLNPGYVGPAFLDAWADWNGNGSWADAGDQIAASLALVPGPNNVPVTPPAGSAGVAPVCRFRLSTVGGLSYTGAALDGEVEDHDGPVIAPPPVAPTVNEVWSVRDHVGAATVTHKLDVLTPRGTATYACEARCGGYQASPIAVLDPGPDRIEIVFDMAVQAADGTLDTEVSVSTTPVNSGQVDSLALGTTYVANDTVIADVSNFLDLSCLHIAVSGIARGDNSAVVMAPANYQLLILAGNCRDDEATHQVNINDVNDIKANWFLSSSAASYFQVDIVIDDQVNITDLNVVKLNWFQPASCP